MTKTQTIGLGVGIGLVLLGAGGAWFWHAHHETKLSDGLASSNVGSSSSSQSLTPTAGQPISLDRQTAKSGGLSVGGSSLGQLNSGQGSSGSSSSSSSSSASGIDPSTFKEYDKYKDGQSGLFGDVKVGTGDELKAGMKAAVYYKGWLTDGTLFDESRAGSDGKLQPLIFTLGNHEVVGGLEQGVAGMKAGGTRLVIIPPAVGYGASGQGPVPGNAVMVFLIQLADVQ